MYTSLKVKPQNTSQRFSNQTPYKGENFRQFSALLQPNQALKVQNYIPDNAGKMKKRKGLEKIFEVAGNNPISLLKRYTSNQIIFAYSTTVAVYNETTQVITNIKTNFTANNGFDGVVYGDYFFVCNGVDKIWRIFTDLSITEVAASPICKKLFVNGPRLYAGNISTDSTAIKYSEIDSGTNPPFTTWTVGTAATDGGLVNFRNGGSINDIAALGDIIVAFSEYGFWAFQTVLQENAGAVVKVDQVVIDRLTVGAQSATVTSKGIFFADSAGIWNLVSLGQPNIPYSSQYANISYILGGDYFSGIDFTGSDMAFDENENILYVTCKSGGSSANNYIIAYNNITKAFGRLTNLNISTFFIDSDNTIWGASSVATKGYKMFQADTDDGTSIGTQYYQELNVGDFNTAKDLTWFAAQCDLSPFSTLTFSFDIIDYLGNFQSNIASYCMTQNNQILDLVGWGQSPYNSGYGSAGAPLSVAQPSYDGYQPMIRNFQRIFVNVTSGDESPHTLNLFFADVLQKSRIRKRLITPC